MLMENKILIYPNIIIYTYICCGALWVTSFQSTAVQFEIHPFLIQQEYSLVFFFLLLSENKDSSYAVETSLNANPDDKYSCQSQLWMAKGQVIVKWILALD